MKKLFTLSLLLTISLSLFSQLYHVAFDENQKPYGVKIYDDSTIQKFKFEDRLQDGSYEIKYNGNPMIFDLSHWDSNNQNKSKLETFEPGIIPEGDLIRTFAFSPDGSIFAALYQHSDNVYFFNSATYELLGIVNVGREPMDIVVTEDYAYVCCHTTNQVNVIQLSDYTVKNTFEVYENPCQVEVDEEESIVYVACNSDYDGSVSAYDINSGLNIFHSSEPYIDNVCSTNELGRDYISFTEFSLSPDKDKLIAINTSDHNPVILDAHTGEILKTFDFGGAMKETGFSGDTLYICTTHRFSSTSPDTMSIHRININDFSVIDSINAYAPEAFLLGYANLAINADGTKVLSVGDYWNAQYHWFDFNTYTCQTITDFNIIPNSKFYTSHDKRYAITQLWFIARVIDLETGEILDLTPQESLIGYAGSISPIEDKIVLGDGNYKISTTCDERFFVLDFNDPVNMSLDTTIISGEEPEADITNTAFLSNDGSKLIATNKRTDNISIIDYTTGQLDTLIFMEGVSDVKSIPYSNNIIASGQETTNMLLIDLANSEIIAELNEGETDILFVTENGKNAYAFEILSSELGELRKIEINGAGSQVIDELLVPFSNCVYIGMGGIKIYSSPGISPDGNYMLFGSVDNIQGDVINIVDTYAMEIVSTLKVANDCIFGYAFTDDSKRACVLTYDYQISIVNLDGVNSYVEHTITLDDASFSADYHSADGLFYVVTKSNTLYLIDPVNGDIVDQHLIMSPDYSYQIAVDADGNPVVRSANQIIYNNELYGLPGNSMNFSYHSDNNLFVIPIPGPDKVCIFDPLATSVNYYPSKETNEDISVFPNPASDEVIIQSKEIIKNIKIRDSQGRMILNKVYNKTKVNVSLKDYKTGIYYIVVDDLYKKKTHKLIITH